MTLSHNLSLILKGGRQPVEALVETVTGGGAGGLDVPLARAERVEAKLVSDLGNAHSVGEILFVRKNEEDGITELVLTKNLLQLEGSLINTLAIVRVDDVDNTLSVLVVVSPEGANLVLSTDIPHGEVDVLVLNCLNVESNGGNGGNNLSKLPRYKERSIKE